MILVDASLAAKWLLPEQGSDKALELITGRELLAAPALIRIEVLAAITRSARKGLATVSESRDRCQKWLGYLAVETLSLIADESLLNEAIPLALEVKHPLQDCLYLAAARQNDARLVTADRTFYERAGAVYDRVDFLPGCHLN